MQPIHYILADDDPVYLKMIRKQIDAIQGFQCLAFCEDAYEVMNAIKQQNPDLLILDVEMPELTGIQLAKSLKENPVYIFISAHSQFALDAFEVDAIDFLVKPVAPERLFRALEKARELIELRRGLDKNTAQTMAGDEDAFFIRDRDQYIRLQFQDVLYFESMGDFIQIYLRSGEKRLALVNLKNLEAQIPVQRFLRISRSHLVNRSAISSLTPHSVSLNQIQLPIGKTYIENVQQEFLQPHLLRRKA